jgi:hypothetical protein
MQNLAKAVEVRLAEKSVRCLEQPVVGGKTKPAQGRVRVRNNLDGISAN